MAAEAQRSLQEQLDVQTALWSAGELETQRLQAELAAVRGRSSTVAEAMIEAATQARRACLHYCTMTRIGCMRASCGLRVARSRCDPLAALLGCAYPTRGSARRLSQVEEERAALRMSRLRATLAGGERLLCKQALDAWADCVGELTVGPRRRRAHAPRHLAYLAG